MIRHTGPQMHRHGGSAPLLRSSPGYFKTEETRHRKPRRVIVKSAPVLLLGKNTSLPGQPQAQSQPTPRTGAIS